MWGKDTPRVQRIHGTGMKIATGRAAGKTKTGMKADTIIIFGIGTNMIKAKVALSNPLSCGLISGH